MTSQFPIFNSQFLVSILDFFFNDTATNEIYTLSLHDALPISCCSPSPTRSSFACRGRRCRSWASRSEEHTSELQSQFQIVCRLLLEKKNMHGYSCVAIVGICN